jgi:hypothetical protein
MQAAVSEPPTLIHQLSQPSAQGSVVGRFGGTVRNSVWGRA